MKEELNHSLFSQHNDALFVEYGTFFSSQSIKKNGVIAFKEHPQFQTIIDILSRKNTHHVALSCSFSFFMREHFLTAFAFYLQQEFVPMNIRHAEILYLDVEKALHVPDQSIEQDFLFLTSKLEETKKYLLIVLSNSTPFKASSNHYFYERLQNLLHAHSCRFIVFTNDQIHPRFLSDFSKLSIEKPNEQDILALLKQHRAQLETFHHVIIPEELLGFSYTLSERYLSSTDTFTKTALLLDSAAARAKSVEMENPQFKPIVSLHILQNVLSNWTHIPVSHLQMHKIKLNEFTLGLQQRVFGQDTAIHLLSQHLLQSQIQLQYRRGPYAAFHFTGPKHSGKHTLTLALAEQLFNQLSVVYISEITILDIPSLFNLKFQRGSDKQIFSLKQILHDCPYAILFLNFHDEIPRKIQNELYDLLNSGILQNEDGMLHYFNQITLILSTTFGDNILSKFATRLSPLDEEQEMDLMKLISTEKKQAAIQSAHHVTNDVLQEIQTEVQRHLPHIGELLPIIPFLPLSKTALENIIRLKLKLLCKTLDARFGIEFGYAPEVIHYLANDVVLRQKLADQTMDIEKVLKQLYLVVELAILNQSENKNRPNQLFLQLNETGQLLRCDWLVVSAARQHAQ